MLHVFRKYEKVIYIVITVVIILSFSFFGTYSALQTPPVSDKIAFQAVDGSLIKRSELEQMVQFISTSSEEKLLFGGAWGPNFLNDGVIKKDILQPGLAEILIAGYKDHLKKDLESRLAKEKRFQPYVHPQAEFVSAANVWGYIAPDLKSSYESLRLAKNPTENEAIDARVRLFLEERNLPAPTLRQVLKYQEKQYGFVTHDPNLDYKDLSLFGYHTLEDWFGPSFMRLVAEFIINSSIIAKERGYVVTKDEALADLLKNAEKSFQQNIQNPNLGVATSKEYFNQQLMRMGMDKNQAIKIWQDVLLFRRLFEDPSNAVIVSPFLYKSFFEYAKEKVEGTLYKLPEILRFNDFTSLQKFETYIKAVSNKLESPLGVPFKVKDVDEVAINYPELVQRTYNLKVAHVDKERLAARVSVKETWDWQVQDENWEKLKKRYPEIGTKSAEAKEKRFALLDKLDPNTRLRVDNYARLQIIEQRPEVIDQALENAETETLEIKIPRKGNLPFAGFEDATQLIELLDSSKKLERISGDQKNFYRIEVLNRSDNEMIATFEQALNQGILDALVDKELDAYFQTIRNDRSEIKNKPFKEVKQKVAELYYADLLKAIEKDYLENSEGKEKYKQLLPDVAASLRFYKYMRDALASIKKDPASKKILRESKEVSLDNQWKLVPADTTIDRSRPGIFDVEKLLSMQKGDFSTVSTPANGDLQFLRITGKGKEFNLTDINDQLWGAHQLLAQEAMRVIMRGVMDKIQSKDAINLDFIQ